MNRFSRPAYAQSNVMTLVALSSATSVALADTNATPASNADGVAAAISATTPSILYPTGDPVLNNIDTLIVSYKVPWDDVRLAVYCGESQELGQILYSFNTENGRRQDG
jgi:hypothetical protein